jgi:hypothetical protein
MMNPTILKFAEQAEFSHTDLHLHADNFQRFTELIVQECAAVCMSRADRNAILTRFGLPVPGDVQYTAPPAHNSITSQYDRPYNLPRT